MRGSEVLGLRGEIVFDDRNDVEVEAVADETGSKEKAGFVPLP